MGTYYFKYLVCLRVNRRNNGPSFFFRGGSAPEKLHNAAPDGRFVLERIDSFSISHYCGGIWIKVLHDATKLVL
jgi:hypothetical protein